VTIRTFENKKGGEGGGKGYIILKFQNKNEIRLQHLCNPKFPNSLYIPNHTLSNKNKHTIKITTSKNKGFFTSKL